MPLAETWPWSSGKASRRKSSKVAKPLRKQHRPKLQRRKQQHKLKGDRGARADQLKQSARVKSLATEPFERKSLVRVPRGCGNCTSGRKPALETLGQH